MSTPARRDALATVAEHTQAAYEHVRSEAQRLEAELICVAAERNEIADRLGASERKLSVLQGSTSWRLTWPLHALVTVLRRLTAGLENSDQRMEAPPATVTVVVALTTGP